MKSKEKLANDVIDKSAAQRYRLLDTEWQRSRPCFCDSQSITNWTINRPDNCCEFSFQKFISIGRARECAASSLGVPFKECMDKTRVIPEYLSRP